MIVFYIAECDLSTIKGKLMGQRIEEQMDKMSVLLR